jgi:hypothetical protein
MFWASRLDSAALKKCLVAFAPQYRLVVQPGFCVVDFYLLRLLMPELGRALSTDQGLGQPLCSWGTSCEGEN